MNTIKYFWKPNTNYIVEWTPELEKVARQRGLEPYDPYETVRSNPLERGLVIPPVKTDEVDLEELTKGELVVYAKRNLKATLSMRLSGPQMRDEIRKLQSKGE